ncbi:MAG: homoserine dehydrogenase, partial [Pseudomonadota bacterium]|nr:homoserine dehydrogenase [Pseudomonadota bacterium]
MSDTIKLAVAGLGTVGVGAIELLDKQTALLMGRSGKRIEIVAVSARVKSKNRGVNLSKFEWFDDPVDMAKNVSADVFVELIGGSEGPAKNACEAAIAA